MRIYVIDNGGQWTHREWRVLKYLKQDTKIVPNSVPLERLKDVDALVLSGGSPSVATDQGRMGCNGEYLEDATFPILGICAGMQFMCEWFGGTLGPAQNPEYGKAELIVDDHDDILAGLPDRFIVWESHNDEVKALPENMDVLAHSESCLYEAVRVKDRPLFGLQFHPEVENTEHGADIFRNFVRIVEEWHS